MLLAAFSNGTHAQAAPAPPASARQPTLADLDMMVAKLRVSIGEFHAKSDQFQPDAAGRTPAKDADRWLLPPDVTEELARLRSRWEEQAAANDMVALRRTQNVAGEIVVVQLMREDLLTGYWWSLMAAIQAHQKVLQPLLDRLPENERASTQGRIVPLVEKLPASILPLLESDFADAESRTREMTHTWVAALAAYNEERGRVAALLSAQDRKDGRPSQARDRQSPCPPASGGTTGTTSPGLDPSSSLKPEFDDELKALAFMGIVRLRVQVSATGCATRAEIFDSSGVPEFDDSALRWAERALFLPGALDGKAIEGTVVVDAPFQEIIHLGGKGS
jgi:TonB family protein